MQPHESDRENLHLEGVLPTAGSNKHRDVKRLSPVQYAVSQAAWLEPRLPQYGAPPLLSALISTLLSSSLQKWSQHRMDSELSVQLDAP